MARDSAINKELDGDDTPPLGADLFTAEQVQWALGIRPASVYRLVERGKLPAYKIGGPSGKLLRFRRADVEALLVPVVPRDGRGTRKQVGA